MGILLPRKHAVRTPRQRLTSQTVAILSGDTIGSNLASLVSLRTAVGLAAFVYASVQQHQCHRYLGGLRKYTLPSEGMFRYFICPHYTFEFLIYVTFTFIAAPQGQTFNHTLVCALALVTTILTITAQASRDWYIQKFGSDKVLARWRMIPFLF